MKNNFIQSAIQKVFLLTICFLVCSALYAIPSISLSDTTGQIGIKTNVLGVLEDRECAWTIKDVSSPEFKDRFQFIKDSLPVNKNKNSVYWLRFTISNTALSKQWLLEMFDPDINFVSFYIPDDKNQYWEQHSGNLLPFKNKIYPHKNFGFDLPLAAGETKTFYLRLKSENENVMTPVIRSQKVFMEYALGEYYVLGIFYGILLMMAVYNFILFTAIHKKYYLYYVLYVISIALYSMCQNGFAFQYLWPDHPDLNRFAFGLALYGTIIFSMLFTKSFLNLKEKLPLFNKILNWTIGLRTVVLFAGLIFFRFLLDAIYLDIVMLSITFLSGVLCYLNGDKASKYFVFAYCFLFIAFLVSAFEFYGFIGSHILTVYSLNIGIILDILFLSISLADRLRMEIKLREEAQKSMMEELKANEVLKDKVNKELEEKVGERTVQLSSALEKLEKQAEEITRMNLILDTANRSLQKDVSEIAKTRIMNTYVDFEEFTKVYPDALSCYRFLEELKVKQLFVCKKCHSPGYGKGKELFDRRCSKCGYNESITANTIFHKLKFPIVKAFYIIHLVTTRKNITAEELSQLLSLRKTTCSGFKKKVQERLNKRDPKNTHSWDILILDDEFEMHSS